MVYKRLLLFYWIKELKFLHYMLFNDGETFVKMAINTENTVDHAFDKTLVQLIFGATTEKIDEAR